MTTSKRSWTIALAGIVALAAPAAAWAQEGAADDEFTVLTSTAEVPKAGHSWPAGPSSADWR
jgi:hypothetical protein